MRTPRTVPGLAAALAVLVSPFGLTGCGGSAPAPETAGSPASPAARPGTAADETAARAAWDAAIKLRFGGDEVASHAAMVQLAAHYPDTRYGRIAADGGGAGTLVAVATVGVLAAVAVPAFTRYVRRAKTAEATANVERIYAGAVAWRAEECARLGKACAKKFKFPPSAPLTPAAPACEGGESRPFPPDAKRWETPTWKALHFALTEPSRYQYEFVSEGQGAGARFTVRAVGDLDCDGATSAFERMGVLDAAGNVAPVGELFVTDEAE